MSLWDKLAIKLQEVIVMFVRKQCAREHRQLNQQVKHFVNPYNSLNETLCRGPIKSETTKSLLSNRTRTHFYACYQTVCGRTKRFYLGRKLAKAEKSLECAKDFCNWFPLGIDFVLPQTH